MLLKSINKRFLIVLLFGLTSCVIFIHNLQGHSLYNKTFVVVLDAGHGGHDSGNRGNGYYEKNIALNISLEIGNILEKHNSPELHF